MGGEIRRKNDLITDRQKKTTAVNRKSSQRLFFDNVRNFVKNLYFILIKIYHTACFFQAQETVLSAIGGCSVEQGRVLRRVRCGSVPLYTTKPAQAQG